MKNEQIEKARDHFAKLINEQLIRIDEIRKSGIGVNYETQRPIIIGVCRGDGIGPIISRETERVLEFLLADEIRLGRVEFRDIEGLTIENRVKHLKAIPDDVLIALKECHIILKAPTTTPEKNGPYPNIESANVAMRRELDLFANIRPIKVDSEGIDWVFFRENIEGAYILGSEGIQLNNDLAIDFTVATRPGCERIIEMAFDYAHRNGINRVTVVTKANVIKTTDGLFLESAKKIARKYPGIFWDSWYIDIIAAKLIDPKRRRQFRVLVMPNQYGDILSDEAAEFQGGVGQVGCANIGKRYAMFEAVHGSAPRMINEGRGQYADPSSLLRGAAMMIRHIGLKEKADQLELALDTCTQSKRGVVITGRPDGATAGQFCDYLLDTLKTP